MGFFDHLAQAAVTVTDSVMGDEVTWAADEETIYSGSGKYINMHPLPNSGKIGDKNTGMERWAVEITTSDFPGLKELVDNNSKPIIGIEVRGESLEFYVIGANPVIDGLTTMLELRPKR